jgi:hypothetical protein
MSEEVVRRARSEIRAAAARGEEWAAAYADCEAHAGREWDWREFDAVEAAVGAEKAAKCIVAACKFACTVPHEVARAEAELDPASVVIAFLMDFSKRDKRKNVRKVADQVMAGPAAGPGRPPYLHLVGPLVLDTMRILTDEPAPKLSQRQASSVVFDLVRALAIVPEPPTVPGSEYRFSAEGIRSYWKRQRPE